MSAVSLKAVHHPRRALQTGGCSGYMINNTTGHGNSSSPDRERIGLWFQMRGISWIFHAGACAKLHGPWLLDRDDLGVMVGTDMLHRSGSVDRTVVRVYLGRRGATNGLRC